MAGDNFIRSALAEDLIASVRLQLQRRGRARPRLPSDFGFHALIGSGKVVSMCRRSSVGHSDDAQNSVEA